MQLIFIALQLNTSKTNLSGLKRKSGFSKQCWSNFQVLVSKNTIHFRNILVRNISLIRFKVEVFGQITYQLRLLSKHMLSKESIVVIKKINFEILAYYYMYTGCPINIGTNFKGRLGTWRQTLFSGQPWGANVFCRS